jgi:hypothetical protein
MCTPFTYTFGPVVYYTTIKHIMEIHKYSANKQSNLNTSLKYVLYMAARINPKKVENLNNFINMLQDKLITAFCKSSVIFL